MARPLLDQQMWCWGCDVKRVAGNLLMSYGAEKRPSPDPRFHSAYTFRMTQGAVLSLWGWGLWISRVEKGSLFISRSRFQPRYTSSAVLVPNAWQERDLPNNEDDSCGEATCSYDLLADALNWIGEYESWLPAQVESDYRERVIRKWRRVTCHKSGTPAAEMAQRWFELAQQVQQLNLI